MGLGMPEVVLILVIALIVFGPRKLPELGKSLGQAMSQFRRASEDFKRTWEQEVDLEKTKPGGTATTTAALGSASPETSGYSSDYYSYGYETDYGHESGQGETAVSATPVTTTPAGTDSSASGSPSDGTAGEKAEGESTTPPAPEKKKWI